jgi:uncharacterized protein (TIGR02145 family)
MKKQVLILLLILGVGNLSAQIVLPAYQGVHNTTEMECPETVTDIEGNIYNVVKIGYQCWMAENLRYLPSVVGPSTGSSTIPYYYVHGYDGTNVSGAKSTANYTTYGVLYNWPAAMAEENSSSSNPSGVQGVCPVGWHLPSDTEWQELEIYLGMSSAEANLNAQLRGDIGGKLKEEGEIHWSNPNTGATNESDFSALPAGCRNNVGTFSGLTLYTFFWSSTSVNTGQSQYRALYHDSTAVFRGPHSKVDGKSIRCIKE